MNPRTNEERQPLEKTKRKRRRNRQLQRYRVKLRKAGFTDATIQHLLQGQTDFTTEQEHEDITAEDFEETRVSLIDQVRLIYLSHM